ncbi:toluene tolerance protein [Roseospira marina]|uniref:Toluene tolerance protein n=1 Tax=Roseospira marina TaxID=140057 RepID=A0A5M6IC20_9PROT|nr:ABC transporter substrate-binding protein [Roseospira marina]KAA5605672.1 toluene tolerance protein [Roseospira marina]MBB4313250.1 phospholipid transport system substrate-binding protein [Roseospira marina]MBB5086009.1 phospholipid transport system substrate-binding protein [Roseospira marina]
MPQLSHSLPSVSRRRLLALAGAAALVAVLPRGPVWAQAPADSAAVALIETYQAALLDVMQRAEALGIQGRAEALDDPVRATFDFSRMARAAAGRAWRDAAEAERAAMARAFGDYSVAVHADRFDGFSGERFVIDGTAPGPAGTTLVRTHIDRPDVENVPIDYVVAEGDDGPAVVDVLLKGSISEVALRRSEWASIGARDGLSGLVTALDSLTARMLKTP